jgi:hypothetical protein
MLILAVGMKMWESRIDEDRPLKSIRGIPWEHLLCMCVGGLIIMVAAAGIRFRFRMKARR